MPSRRAPETIKIRAAVGYRLAMCSPLALLIPVRLIHPSPQTTFFLAFWFTYSVANAAVGAWYGVNLTPSEAVIHNVRYRRIAWSRVQAVTREPFLGGQRVVLYTTDGERVPLRSPAVDFTPIGRTGFERRYHEIGQWWLAHRDLPVTGAATD